MLTVEALRSAGADVDSGISRCMGNEDFYIRLVNMALADDGYSALREAVEAHDLEKGFECAHALKGMLSNISLTNVLDPVLEMTEALRAKEDRDYSALLDKMDEEVERLRAL